MNKRMPRVGLVLLLLGLLSMICILVLHPSPSLAAESVAGVSFVAIISGSALLIFGDKL